MSVFNQISKPKKPAQKKDSFALPIKNYPPLSTVTKPLLDTGEMANYLGLDAKTANAWEMGQGTIRPTTETVDGQVWLRWRTEDVRKLAAGR